MPHDVHHDWEHEITAEWFLDPKRVKRDPATGCWNWISAATDGGYGMFSRLSAATRRKPDGRLGCKHYRAHKVSYQLFCGPIPPGLCVMHACDNRRCVNPTHLVIGTHADNARDKEAKGRGGWRARKLNVTIARQMRADRAAGLKIRELAARHGVSTRTAERILSGRYYPDASTPVQPSEQATPTDPQPSTEIAV